MNIGLTEMNNGRRPNYEQMGHLHDATTGSLFARTAK